MQLALAIQENQRMRSSFPPPPALTPELKEDDRRLLEAIQKAARARDVLRDPRWDALAGGTLSEKDRAKLREEAERSPAMREAYELASAFDAKTKAAMIALVAPARPALPKASRWRSVGAVLAFAAVPVALLIKLSTSPAPPG